MIYTLHLSQFVALHNPSISTGTRQTTSTTMLSTLST